MTTPIVLPSPLQGILEAASARYWIRATDLPLISRDQRARPHSYRPTRYRGACSRTRFRFSSAASPLL